MDRPLRVGPRGLRIAREAFATIGMVISFTAIAAVLVLA